MEDSLNEQEKQLQERLQFQVQGLGRVGSSGIPGIRRRILYSLCRSLHGVVAVQAGITLGDFPVISLQLNKFPLVLQTGGRAGKNEGDLREEPGTPPRK